MKTVGLYAWHVHHAGPLCERLTEPIENRQAYMREHKPRHEVAKRLRLLRIVVDQEAIATAERDYEEAIAPGQRAYEEAIAPAQRAHDVAVAMAQRDYDEAVATAWRAHKEAVAMAQRDYDEAVATLHARECPDCPYDGRTIFPGQDG